MITAKEERDGQRTQQDPAPQAAVLVEVNEDVGEPLRAMVSRAATKPFWD